MTAGEACRFGRCRAPGDPELIVARVPANERALVDVDPARRARLRAHLQAIAGAALDAREREADDLPFLDDPLFAGACGVCRGACCLGGGEHAYLDARSMARFLDQYEGASAADAVDAYLAHVAARAYAGSCLFHGERGCTLPRPLRSDRCRTWDCAGLRALVSAATSTRRRRALVIAGDEGRVVRRAVIGG